jgi:hypothetical protein
MSEGANSNVAPAANVRTSGAQVADRRPGRPGWRTVAFSGHLSDAKSPARKLRNGGPGGAGADRRPDVRAISLTALRRAGGADALQQAAEHLEALELEFALLRLRR